MGQKRIENVYDITKRLLGEIEPRGESHTDEARLENLKQTVDLTEQLIEEIIFVVRHKNRGEHSMKVAGEYADKFIDGLRERLIG